MKNIQLKTDDLLINDQIKYNTGFDNANNYQAGWMWELFYSLREVLEEY